MGTMQEAMLRSGNKTIISFVAERKRKQEEMRRMEATRHAKSMRDKAIAEVHRLSYSRKSKDGRGGSLVPRKSANREKLAAAMQKAAVYAALARPDNGYPEPPFRRDPEYPIGAPLGSQDGLDIRNLIAERNRLTFWLQILKSRGAPETTIQNVEAHLLRLARRIDRGCTNDHIRCRPGTKEYTMRPAPRTVMKVIVEYR